MRARCVEKEISRSGRALNPCSHQQRQQKKMTIYTNGRERKVFNESDPTMSFAKERGNRRAQKGLIYCFHQLNLKPKRQCCDLIASQKVDESSQISVSVDVGPWSAFHPLMALERFIVSCSP